MSNHQHEVFVESAKLSPPVAVTGLTFAGVSLQDWVLVATLVYTIFSLFFLIRDKVWKPWKERDNAGE